jgi:hypothetical protein
MPQKDFCNTISPSADIHFGEDQVRFVPFDDMAARLRMFA